MNVRWIIQTNLTHENDLREIQAACEKLGVPYEEIKVIPFSPDLPKFTIDDKTNIYYGSTTLMENTYRLLNKPPGTFYDDAKFSMENYLKVWGDHMLNSEARVTTFGEFSRESHPDDSLWFVRPDADSKSFPGDVREFKDLRNWASSFTKFDNAVLDEDTKIIVAPPYNIRKEWRNYIVNGRVVASSLYRKDFRLNKNRHDCPPDMIKFVEDRCAEYAPHKIFVMDIALTGGDYYIIECGCMNAVGLYDADIFAIVEAVSAEVGSWSK